MVMMVMIENSIQPVPLHAGLLPLTPGPRLDVWFIWFAVSSNAVGRYRGVASHILAECKACELG